MSDKNINGFELIHLLGSGGMAEVWYAENEIQKPAAVKILNEDLAHNASIVERFHNEAKLLVRLEHPNIRQVYGYGSVNGRPAIVMEYLDGADLKTRMAQGQRFTDNELKRWWNQIVDALKYTHEQGVVHRDIKPSNIFVDKNGDVKLLDFGIAKIRESIPMTLTGTMMGTLIYMSPEQVDDSKRIGPKSDIYSLAVTFVNLLTGKAPYDTKSNSDFKIRESIVYKPLDMNGVPADWQTFLTPYLEKDPTKRSELQHFGLSTAKEDTKATTRISKQASDLPSGNSKNRKVFWIGLASAVAAGIIALLLLRQPASEPGPLPDPCTQAFLDCKTTDDFRKFIDDYGTNAPQYAEAQHILDSLVADSTHRAKAEQFTKAEEEAYLLIVKEPSIPNCEAYLQDFPQGPHAETVRDTLVNLEAAKVAADLETQQKRDAELKHDAELKREDEMRKKSTTIEGCENYIKNYPNGRYVTEIQKRLETLQLFTPQELPMSLGTTVGDLTEVKLSGNYLEYVISVNEDYSNIESLQANPDLLKEGLKQLVDNDLSELLVKSKLGYKVTYIGKRTGRKVSASMSLEEIQRILEEIRRNTDTSSPREKIEALIKITNAQLPLTIERGVVLKRLALEGDYLVYYYDINESIYDIDAINSNNTDMKKETLNSMRSGNDLTTEAMVQLCKEAKVGIKHTYVGKSTGKKATITIYSYEL